MNVRRFPPATRIASVCALGLSVGLALSACNPVATSAPAVKATPATTGPTAVTGATTVPTQTAEGGEFLSPSGNISCEVNYHRDGLTNAYCQTGLPARSVTMNIAGRYTTCSGQQCLGNSGDGTPTLAYGTETGVGPFRCELAANGVTCTVDGKGFRISTSGVTPVSA